MSEQREIYDVENREVHIPKRSRRRSNYREIARRNQAIFLLSMALAASVILNVCLVMR